VGIKLKNMNRNTQNWLRATIYVIGGISGLLAFLLGVRAFYNYSQTYFNYTLIGLFGLVCLFALIAFIKEEFDARDASDKYWEETYPSYSKAKKKKETQKEFMKRLDDAWVRDFGKK
jgi:uncharacterized membrane protein YuzA (DUF378 family)